MELVLDAQSCPPPTSLMQRGANSTGYFLTSFSASDIKAFPGCAAEGRSHKAPLPLSVFRLPRIRRPHASTSWLSGSTAAAQRGADLQHVFVCFSPASWQWRVLQQRTLTSDSITADWIGSLPAAGWPPAARARSDTAGATHCLQPPVLNPPIPPPSSSPVLM